MDKEDIIVKAISDLAKVVSGLQDTVFTIVKEVKELKERANADIE